MRVRTIVLLLMLTAMTCGLAEAQLFDAEPVFKVKLVADRDPLVAGDQVQLAAVVDIDPGWHVNSNDPGDPFLEPTTVAWLLPDGWPQPITSFPAGHGIKFPFAEEPIQVWEGRVVMVGSLTVPAGATGATVLRAEVTAQACNDVQCLPPEPVRSRLEVEVAAAGTTTTPLNAELFAGTRAATSADEPPAGERNWLGLDLGQEDLGLGGLPLPLVLLICFIIGLGLNLTPCVYPMIPITVGFFTEQTKERSGGTFWLALTYVLGISFTYTAMGVIAALSHQVFGSALGNPVVIGVIVVVLLALATSMFGLWEFRVPAWALRVSGGRAGYAGALIMGLVVGIVAAPCVGPAVVGLLAYVGKQGSVALGFSVFFSLSMGLGLPYLILGTFTGMINKLPASGMWMVGVKKAFGILLVALAAYFAGPLLSNVTEAWLMAAILACGGLYLLLIDRTGHQQAAIDRVMRAVAAGLIVAGVVLSPVVNLGKTEAEGWQEFDEKKVQEAIAAGEPVILDYYADWCIPCRELDKVTFSDPTVAQMLEGFTRFKADQTVSNDEATAAAAAHDVRGVPTVIVFFKGEEAFRITGFERPEAFRKRLARLGEQPQTEAIPVAGAAAVSPASP